jgi:hypothetical protein
MAESWRTSDDEEVRRRVRRAREERPKIVNTTPEWGLFSDYEVHSRSGETYRVGLRSLAPLEASCTCVDFRINGLGTCKHVEAVLAEEQAADPRRWMLSVAGNTPRIEVVPAPQGWRIGHGQERLPPQLRKLFDPQGHPPRGLEDKTLQRLQNAHLPSLRIAPEIGEQAALRHRAEERLRLRREYETRVCSGEWPAQETRLPLLPYQREGMLFLAFQERALLADEMGLGKTAQAIAACSLLHRLGQVRRVLIVTPASLKGEWLNQIATTTSLAATEVTGAARARWNTYANAPFFTVVHYEQAVNDFRQINSMLDPQVIILDEAQRIRTWNSPTARAIKRLTSRYAFVLSGTPIEHCIEEIWSLVDFLDPAVFGPLFRFNREFLQFDETGRVTGYQNLDRLRNQLRGIMLRRTHEDVREQVLHHTSRIHRIALSPTQRRLYAEHETSAQKLLPPTGGTLSPAPQNRLMRELAHLRMLCDSPALVLPGTHASPKLSELLRLIEDELSAAHVKILIFSEWERMLALAQKECAAAGYTSALHTGSLTSAQRRAAIEQFRNNPDCRILLSTDYGGTSPLPHPASVVIHCDIPWNPARLAQRNARAETQNQTTPLRIYHLVAEDTLEERLLDAINEKSLWVRGVLDPVREIRSVRLPDKESATLDQIRQLLRAPASHTPAPASPQQQAAELVRSLGPNVVSWAWRETVSGPAALIVVKEPHPTLEKQMLDKARTLPPCEWKMISTEAWTTLRQLQSSGWLETVGRWELMPNPAAPAPPPTAKPKSQADDEKLRLELLRKLRMTRSLVTAQLDKEACWAWGETEKLACQFWRDTPLPPAWQMLAQLFSEEHIPRDIHCWNEAETAALP